MGFIYEQSTGNLYFNGAGCRVLIASGYAGSKDCRNRPDLDHVKAQGPLPKAFYRMREVEHPRFASPCIRLTPEVNSVMHGRSGFYIHGDDGSGDASHGCIVMQRNFRLAIAGLMAIGHSSLQVVS